MMICRDVPASIRFYTEQLGFEVANRDDSVGRSGFASLRNGPVQIMLASPTYLPEAPRVEGRYPQAIYYFYVPAVSELHQKLKDNGVAVSDLRVTFYGLKEFELVDPNGHVLYFGQDTDEPQTVKE